MIVTQLSGTFTGIIIILAILFIQSNELDVVSASLGSAAYVIFQSATETPGGALALFLLALSCSI